MHIPDGFVAPQVYIPAYLLDLGLLIYGFGKFKAILGEKTLPYLASLSVLSFVLMSIALPLPGGTSVHGLGVSGFSLLFGPWVSFLCVSLVLFLQAVIFGGGGITTFPLNSIGIGFLGSFCAFYTYKVIKAYFKDSFALFTAGFISTIISALFIALILGIHPHLFKDASGKPLYFPFGFSVVIPALLLPHIVVGIGEGLLTYLIIKLLKERVSRER